MKEDAHSRAVASLGTWLVRDAKGNVEVVHRYALFTEPKVIELRWKARAWTQRISLPGETWEGNEVPAVRTGATPDGTATYRGVGWRVEAQVHGEDKAATSQELPYPQPPGKAPKRYKDGAWQRYHARHGWV